MMMVGAIISLVKYSTSNNNRSYWCKFQPDFTPATLDMDGSPTYLMVLVNIYITNNWQNKSFTHVLNETAKQWHCKYDLKATQTPSQNICNFLCFSIVSDFRKITKLRICSKNTDKSLDRSRRV